MAAFLERHGLKHGIGGYWESSVITVETGGAVTIRAVTPACLQPYKWESKREWYDPSRQHANFLLLSQVKGFFTKFAVNHVALQRLAAMSKPTRLKLDFYTTYVYPFNLFAKEPALSAALSSPTVNCG